MLDDPKKYYDPSDGLVIPELFYQYKFPEVPYTMLYDNFPDYKNLEFTDVISILESYLNCSLKLHSEIRDATTWKQVFVAEDAKVVIWIARTAPFNVVKRLTDNLQKEDKDYVGYIKFEEMNLVYTATVLLPASIGELTIQQLVKEFNVKAKTQDTNQENLVFTLGSGKGGPKLDPHYLELKTYGSDIIDSNYNDDFREVYDVVLKFLRSKESGLVLFDGDPGTGKTSIIKHFISMCSDLDRKLVVVPSAFASVLSEPSFLSFAADNLSDSILLLEDAETALSSRDGSNNDAVSNILNISDGILGDVLASKIIATVNTSNNLDKALLRGGRLIAKYTFKPLEYVKARSLATKLGVDKEKITGNITLADIYNQAPNVFGDKKKGKIGFN